jgi:hypothetical protein
LVIDLAWILLKKKLACAWHVSAKVWNVIWWSKTWDSMWWSYGGFRFILASIPSRCDACYKRMSGLALLILYFFLLSLSPSRFLHWPCNKSNHSLCYFLYLFYVLFITIWFIRDDLWNWICFQYHPPSIFYHSDLVIILLIDIYFIWDDFLKSLIFLLFHPF